MRIFEVEGRAQVGAGADDHDAGGAGVPQSRVQASGQSEVAEVVGGKLHFPAVRGEGACGKGHDPRVRDEDVERPAPCPREAVDGGHIGKIEGLCVHPARTGGGRLLDQGLGGLRVARGDGDLRAGGGQGPDGFGAETRGTAGDHGTAAGEIHAVDHLLRAGVRVEGVVRRAESFRACLPPSGFVVMRPRYDEATGCSMTESPSPFSDRPIREGECGSS